MLLSIMKITKTNTRKQSGKMAKHFNIDEC